MGNHTGHPDAATKTFLVNAAIAAFEKLHPVSQAMRKEVHECTYFKILQDGEVLVEHGGFCREFFVVCHGLLIYSSLYNGKSFTTAFCKPGDHGTSISGLYGAAPSEDRIHAIGQTLLLLIGTDDIQRWYGIYPETNVIMRRLFEQNLKIAHGRANVIRIGTAKEKYAYYKRNKQEYIDAVPLEAIASFLGMKTSTLEQVIKEEESTKARESEAKSLYERLLGYMAEKRPYLSENLTLKKLAGAIGQKPHHISELVNKNGKMNFNDFVNGYRIAYVLEKLKHPEAWKHLKLETLGKSAGFKSRSSFYAVFKKHMGVSPSVYFQQ